MKIAIIGAGAMGCLYGSALSACNDVTLVDSWTPQVLAINAHGITVEEPDGSIRTSMMPAVETGAATGPFDLVIVFVKCLYTEDAVKGNLNAFGPGTTVLTLQNGAGNDRIIARYVPKQNIVVGTSRHGCVNLGDGRIRHSGCGPTTVGSNSGAKDMVDVVVRAFEGSGMELVASDDIQRIIWSKLFVNMSVNALSALLNCRIGFMSENKYAWDYAKRIIYEAVAVAEEDGTYFDRRQVLADVKAVCEHNPNGYASMCQDRRNHRKTEIDFINGAVVEQAKLYGVATPYNALVVDLIHAVEGTYDENPAGMN